MELQQYKQIIDDHLTQMSEVVEHEELKVMIDAAIAAGGKRIRPILCLLGYRLFQDDMQRALPQAAAMEMFHTFSLVHDDIMDEAPVRRGQPSVYFKHGRDKAILAGDVMLILAFSDLLKNLDQHTSARVMASYIETSIQVCEGQMMDMDFEAQLFPTQEEYMEMIKLKTSVLIGASLKVGAIVAGADEHACDEIYRYGILQGLAFQVQDDILDSFGSSSMIGKRVGGDIVQGKKTLLAILCANQMPDKGASLNELLQDATIDEDEKIAQVMALYKKHNVEALANEIKLELVEEAKSILVEMGGESGVKEELSELAHWLLNRSH